MTEAAFPLLGAAFVILVVLPTGALLAKACLVALERLQPRGLLHGDPVRFAVLAGSSLLPLFWFISAGLHRSEPGGLVWSCLFPHGGTSGCFEPELFTFALIGALSVSCIAAWRTGTATRIRRTARTAHVTERIERIIRASAALTPLRGRIVVTDDDELAMATQGLLTPQVVIGAAFASDLADDLLAGALGHECAHLRSRDPLRYFILRVAFAVNPVGQLLLGSHLARWYAACEAHCDREAVLRGAEPLSLANAIVKAARPRACPVALGTGDTAVLRLRIELLLAFSEKRPSACCPRRRAIYPAALLLAVVTLVLPHQYGTSALDSIHSGAERAFSYFWY